MTIGASYVGPQSRGSVTLRSADPGDHPRILNNALTSAGEVEAMLRALELVRQIASQPPLRDLLGEELNPSAAIRSREQLIDWLRATCEHEYRPSCTCRIGSPEQGVLDAELRVHGVESLRVAEASAQPRIVSANTQAVKVAIAERLLRPRAAAGRRGGRSARVGELTQHGRPRSADWLSDLRPGWPDLGRRRRPWAEPTTVARKARLNSPRRWLFHRPVTLEVDGSGCSTTPAVGDTWPLA
jgi:hypothetical protein